MFTCFVPQKLICVGIMCILTLCPLEVKAPTPFSAPKSCREVKWSLKLGYNQLVASTLLQSLDSRSTP